MIRHKVSRYNYLLIYPKRCMEKDLHRILLKHKKKPGTMILAIQLTNNHEERLRKSNSLSFFKSKENLRKNLKFLSFFLYIRE